MEQKQDTLKPLRDALPRGSYGVVRQRLGNRYSERMINHVANGTRTNDEILDALFAYAEEMKELQRQRFERIKQLA